MPVTAAMTAVHVTFQVLVSPLHDAGALASPVRHRIESCDAAESATDALAAVSTTTSHTSTVPFSCGTTEKIAEQLDRSAVPHFRVRVTSATTALTFSVADAGSDRWSAFGFIIRSKMPTVVLKTVTADPATTDMSTSASDEFAGIRRRMESTDHTIGEMKLLAASPQTVEPQSSVRGTVLAVCPTHCTWIVPVTARYLSETNVHTILWASTDTLVAQYAFVAFNVVSDTVELP